MWCTVTLKLNFEANSLDDVLKSKFPIKVVSSGDGRDGGGGASVSEFCLFEPLGGIRKQLFIPGLYRQEQQLPKYMSE